MIASSRIEAPAHTILDYSLELKPGEKLLFEGETGCEPLVRALIAVTYARGALPFFEIMDPRLHRAWLLGADKEQLEQAMKWFLTRAQDMDAFLCIQAGDNLFELADGPGETMQHWNRARTPLREEKLSKKWSLLRHPTSAGAQAAGMSTEAFEELLFEVCTMDYASLSSAMDPLVALMEKTDRVEIKGPGTELSFSTRGLPAIKRDGKLNIPTGRSSPLRSRTQ